MIDSTKINYTPREKLGHKLQQFRLRNDLVAQDLAKIIGLSRECYSQREAGRTKLCAVELIALCRAYPDLHGFLMQENDS